MTTEMAPPWWRSAVVYHVYPRSFADGSGDGIGDLAGVRAHLDHLAWLGVDAVWLSPFYRSPMRDAGYDVADHCAVDELFGSLADIDALIAAAHERGLRVLVDYVPNHTSDEHPWFVASRSSRDNPQRDWYLWRDRPNNWVAAFTRGSAWTLDEPTKQYYLHMFLEEQPDLNWANPEVVTAMHDVLRFWLDRGVDGFRIDVAHGLGKDPAFADDERAARGEPLSSYNDQPATHPLLRGIRRVVDAYPGDRVVVGEVNLRPTGKVVPYYGDGDELHLAFNFAPADLPWDATGFRAVITDVERRHREAGAWPTWVLSNHDLPRHRTRYGGSLARARAAAVLLLTLRGTAFVYQGEELGLEDAVVSPDARVDPGGRDGARAPIPWEADAPYGWSGRSPWLPFPPDAGRRSAAAGRADEASILHLYRALLSARRNSAALALGSFAWIEGTDDAVLAWHRQHGGDERVVAVNFADRPAQAPVGGRWRIEVASDGAAGDYAGRLGPDQAVVLRPA